MRRPIPLIGDQSQNRIAEVSNQRSINFEPTYNKPNAKTPMALYSAPGLKLDAIVGVGPCRSNGIKWGGSIYFVTGNSFVRREPSGVWTTIGEINTTGGWCVISKGRAYIAFVDGVDGWAYDGTTFAQIIDPDFPAGATHLSYLNGRWAANQGDSDRFYLSGTEDPYAWAPLDFATAEANPDNILAHIATNRDIYFLGKDTIQVYFDSGSLDFPLAPYQDVIEMGIDAKYSLAKGVQGLFFLASNEEGDRMVVKAMGFGITILSDDDLNWQINKLPVTNDAIGSLYRHKGQTWYQLTFPSADITYILNVDKGGWYQRKSANIGRFRVSGIGFLDGKVICGDYTSGRMYQLDYDSITEDGNTIERRRTAQVMQVDQRDMEHNELVVDIKTGVGNVAGSDPLMQIRYSDDGEHTWSSWLTASMGKLGEYNVRLKWSKLGTSPNRVYELLCNHQAEVHIYNAYLEARTLNS
ncbi:hypothetical protein MNBD_ALPHA03-1275 [hydrothermal vent metagenome]|uniref:Phage protein n=1 Tax=hydrothermal vent metagenome TaxID=652676 RepID=A0A3B1B1I1_9ZZZZ